jgi:hypothetical protein
MCLQCWCAQDRHNQLIVFTRSTSSVTERSSPVPRGQSTDSCITNTGESTRHTVLWPLGSESVPHARWMQRLRVSSNKQTSERRNEENRRKKTVRCFDWLASFSSSFKSTEADWSSQAAQRDTFGIHRQPYHVFFLFRELLS